MYQDIQKASLFKRISAYLFDIILTVCLVVGLAALLSHVLNYDNYYRQLTDAYDKYEQMYGVELTITQGEYDAMTAEEQEAYLAACDQVVEALNQDEQAVRAYSMTVNLMLVIVSVSTLLSMVLLELMIPLLLKNGQTLGKKIFGIGLMRKDGIRVTPFMMFVRTVLGKYTLETMIPVLIIVGTFIFGVGGTLGLMILSAIMVLQVMLPLMTRNRSSLHDFMALTVAVDIQSQRIFESAEAQEAYYGKSEAEEAAQSDH